MFDSIIKFFKKFSKEEDKESGSTAKERLHLVLMQDRANVSADFMELMKQEIIEVIKKYINADENAIDVKLTNKVNSDGTTGAPILYANIPIISVKDETKQLNIERKLEKKEQKTEVTKSDKVNKEEKSVENEEYKKNEETEKIKSEETNSNQEQKEDNENKTDIEENKEEDKKLQNSQEENSNNLKNKGSKEKKETTSNKEEKLS